MRVVCISSIPENRTTTGAPVPENQKPKKGEIYTVSEERQQDHRRYYVLLEIPQFGFLVTCFRPVDETFGPAVCERIEEQIEYEQAIEV